MKGDTHWIVIVAVSVLILLALVAAGLVNFNALGKMDDVMGEAEIKGICDHLECGSSICCKEGGSQQKELMQCIRNSTDIFRDSCIDSNRLKEYFCQADGKISFEIIYCGFGGCVNGACSA